MEGGAPGQRAVTPEVVSALCCPECRCSTQLEPLGHNWYWCGCCTARVLYDASGVAVRVLQR